jgi:HSP20 family molecular chaperone IbpA
MFYSSLLLALVFPALAVAIHTQTLTEILDAKATSVSAEQHPSFHWPAWHLFDKVHLPAYSDFPHWSRPSNNFWPDLKSHVESSMSPYVAGAKAMAPLDFKETANDFQLAMDFPGMKKDEIAVTVKGNVLTISGERRFEEKKDSENYHRVERYFGHTSRSFHLPTNANEENLSASYTDGVLNVVIPKRTDGSCVDGAKKIVIA